MRLVLLTTFLLGMLSGCWPERHTRNQRMTVTVETPEGVVSASSVIEVRAEYYEGGERLTGTKVRYSYTGRGGGAGGAARSVALRADRQPGGADVPRRARPVRRHPAP